MPTTTSTTDPLLTPDFTRHYLTVNHGIPPWIFALVFVVLAATVLVLAVALSRNTR